MSYNIPSFQSILERFSRLRQAPIGGGRAPHKPLLILLMLGRHQRGDRGAASFQAIREPLEELLRDFGPPTAAAPDVVNPFWRLQNDEGRIWEVRDSSGTRVAETVSPPTIGTLLERDARGNFAGDLCDAFKAHPEYLSCLASHLLAAHFPPSLHEAICATAGIDVPEGIPEEPIDLTNPRDPQFRARIIRAYEYRCAITGWDLRVGHSLAGLEAAHIKWHIAGGPSTEQNGIALNSLFHKLFDLGVFTLSLAEEVPLVLVSQEANGGDSVRDYLIGRHGRPIREPQNPDWLPLREFITWHHQEVFKAPARR